MTTFAPVLFGLALVLCITSARALTKAKRHLEIAQRLIPVAGHRSYGIISFEPLERPSVSPWSEITDVSLRNGELEIEFGAPAVTGPCVYRIYDNRGGFVGRGLFAPDGPLVGSLVLTVRLGDENKDFESFGAVDETKLSALHNDLRAMQERWRQ